MDCKYKRILLKLSGEALAGDGFGIDFKITEEVAKTIKECLELGTQIAIVVGGGNFWRGRSSGEMNRVRADYIGMLATCMNALALSESFEKFGIKNKIQTTSLQSEFTEQFNFEKAIKYLEKGKVMIFAYGTGHPYFSTDTASALRAAEIGADVIFKAISGTDGVYDSDPNKNPDAKKFNTLTFDEVIEKDLKVMDTAAAAICKESKIPILVFSMENLDNILKAAKGEKIGTFLTI